MRKAEDHAYSSCFHIEEIISISNMYNRIIYSSQKSNNHKNHPHHIKSTNIFKICLATIPAQFRLIPTPCHLEQHLNCPPQHHTPSSHFPHLSFTLMACSTLVCVVAPSSITIIFFSFIYNLSWNVRPKWKRSHEWHHHLRRQRYRGVEEGEKST